MKPLLAHVYEPHRVTYPCYVQPKLNGIRALYQNGRFQSRDEHPFPPRLLEHLSASLRELFDNKIILDGELYVHGWPLQRINAAVTPVREEATEDTRSVEYHVFDVVDYTLPIRDRNLIRRSILHEGAKETHPPYRSVKTIVANNEGEANEHYARFVEAGYEGMMYRLGDCPYTVPKQKTPFLNAGLISYNTPLPRSGFFSDQDNRCWHLLKRKSWQDDEFEIVGVVEGEGRLVNLLGAIICQTPEGRRFNVGSGFSDDDRYRYWNKPPIGHEAKVKFLCLSSDGIPLNPTLLAILS